MKSIAVYIEVLLTWAFGPPMCALVEVIRNNSSVFLLRSPTTRFYRLITLWIRGIQALENYGGIPTGYCCRLVTPQRADLLEGQYRAFLDIKDGSKKHGLVGKLIARYQSTRREPI